MGIVGLDPAGMELAIGRLRSQADALEGAADLARSALFVSDLSSPVVRSIVDRAEKFRLIADELQVRVDIVARFRIDPGSIDSEPASAAFQAGLASVDTLFELNDKIDRWGGTDNDPTLDGLLRQRNQLMRNQFGEGSLDPLVAAVAEANGLSYEEADLVVTVHRVDELTDDMALLAGPWTDTEWRQLDQERDALLAHLFASDEAVADEVARSLNSGVDLFDAIGPAVHAAYGGATIVELQAAIEHHSAEGSFGLALFDLSDLHVAAVEGFTGVRYELVNPMIAGVAQRDGQAYNALVEGFNAAVESGDMEGEPVSRIAINGTIPNDATLTWNLSQQVLFNEMETARQRDRSDYDGKLSRIDLHSIVDSPGDFSAGAVAAAEMLLADDQLRGRIDTAGSRQFLDGLAQGRHTFEGADGIISFADVQQHVTNSLVHDLLRPEAELLDTDADGRITKLEFEARLAAVDPDGSVAAAIHYALSDEAFDDRDRRTTWQKIGDGVFTIGSLNPANPLFYHRMLTEPSELAGDFGSFTQGLLWEFPKGAAVLAYDFSSLVPGSPAYLIETHTNWGGDEHRGVAMLTGLADVADVGLTLVPGTPQFYEELARVRRSGRMSDHAGIGLVATVADWQTFVDDPAQWFGTITGEVLLTAATGGYGGVAMRGGAGLRGGMLLADGVADTRHIRHWAGTRLEVARSSARLRAAHMRSFAGVTDFGLPSSQDFARLRDLIADQMAAVEQGAKITLGIDGQPQLAGIYLARGVDDLPVRTQWPLGGGSTPASLPANVASAKAANYLKDWQSPVIRVGDRLIMIPKERMIHILTRHHPDFWDGSTKADQSFLPKSWTADDIETAIRHAINDNRDHILESPGGERIDLAGELNGREYAGKVKDGLLVQFFLR